MAIEVGHGPIGNAVVDAGNLPVKASGSTTYRALNARAADVVNVKDFGAVADWNGATGTDNRAAFQAAIDHMESLGGGMVYVPTGAYQIGPNSDATKASLVMASNVSIVGDGPRSYVYFAANNTGQFKHHCFASWEGYATDEPSSRWSGAIYPSALLEMTSANQGAYTIAEAAAGNFANVVAGEWIAICEGDGASGWDTKRQWAKVVSNVAGTITLDQALIIDFNNDSDTTIGIYRSTPIEKAWLIDLTIEGDASYNYGFSAQEAIGGGLLRCSLSVESGVSCFAVLTQDFSLLDCTWTNGMFGGFSSGVRGLLSRNRFVNVGTGGVTLEDAQGSWGTRVIDNVFNNCNTNNGFFVSVSDGFYFEFSRNHVSGNYNTWGPLKIDKGRGPKIIKNNVFIGVEDGGIVVGTAGYPNNYQDDNETYGVLFDGNVIVSPPGCTGQIVMFAEFPQCYSCQITNNTFVGDYVSDGVSGLRIGGLNVGDSDLRTFTVFGNRSVQSVTGMSQPLATSQDGVDLGSGLQFFIPLGFGRCVAGAWDLASPTLGGTSTSFDEGTFLFAFSGANKIGYVSVGGTSGTLNSGNTTGSIDVNTKVLTVNTMSQLAIGRYITIAGVTGIKKIVSIDRAALQVTVDTNADATIVGAAVAFSAPTVQTIL